MLREEELHQLEATLLPALERHHLRLLAHGLRTLQAVGQQALPSRSALEAWAAAQPAIAADPGFQAAFVEQMLGVAVQLETIAVELESLPSTEPRQEGSPRRGPLDLELDDLVRWARQQADQRLADPRETSPPPG
jgi:hypothetical protein